MAALTQYFRKALFPFLTIILYFPAMASAECCADAACDCAEPSVTCIRVWGCGGSMGCSCQNCCSEPFVVSREAFCDMGHLSCLTDALNFQHGNFSMPVTGGAYHWFHQSLIGNSGGYGIDGLRGTYFYYLYFDPQVELDSGRSAGGHVELRLRDGDTFRSFIDEKIWTWEAYAYVKDEDWGTFKAGQLYKQFGKFWDGVFFGNAPYFDGAKLDADYGISWESTYEVNKCLKIDRFYQFFFHEDSSNGSFGGGDAESVAGYTEENTGVVRIVPTWDIFAMVPRPHLGFLG